MLMTRGGMVATVFMIYDATSTVVLFSPPLGYPRTACVFVVSTNRTLCSLVAMLVTLTPMYCDASRF